ncbi:MAG: signal recognition particle protein [Endozoicomonadaceae bacterium]|nr:signal recognition particle protein [Endozoicomonadaceae bacterium]MBE8233490.1 signal recognition particle protein [Endozoicomonadaceae bacterium]
MFQNLTDRLSATLRSITGKSKLTEDNIQSALREVKTALLEADVALGVVKDFTNQVRKRALGTEVKKSLKPGQLFVKIMTHELTQLMGSEEATLNLKCQPPAVILMAGLQGAGKTTTVAKLGCWLKLHEKKTVLVASTDIYRPAAIEQLSILAQEAELHFFPSTIKQLPKDIAKAAIAEATLRHYDVVIIDTAGRLHIDDDMMHELKALQQLINPIETLFVVDAMTGQDAANSAKIFNENVSLTGIILTKIDSDARGGAALSVKFLTGKPIKFLGTGEKNNALERFYPDRMASRILGMGDILSLIEEAENNIDSKKVDKLIKKIKKGKSFDFNDLKEQLLQMKKMGGIASMLNKLPSNMIPAHLSMNSGQLMQDKSLVRMNALIDSMTPEERSNPDILSGSRKKRIAAGAGADIPAVNQLLKQYKQLSKTMKKIKGKNLNSLMNNMTGTNTMSFNSRR